MPSAAEQLRQFHLESDASGGFIIQNPDQTREMEVKSGTEFDAQGQRCECLRVSLYNIDIPPGWKMPRSRVKLMQVIERVYQDGKTTLTVSVEGTKAVKGMSDRTLTFGDVIYQDDGQRQIINGASFIFPLTYRPPQRINDGIRPVDGYPQQIDTKATAQALVAQMRGRDFKTPQLIIPQAPTVAQL